MNEVKEKIQDGYIVSPHGHLFLADGIMYNRELEKEAMQKEPLGLIGRAIKTSFEKREPEVFVQLKFEGLLYFRIKELEGLALQRRENLISVDGHYIRTNRLYRASAIFYKDKKSSHSSSANRIYKLK